MEEIVGRVAREVVQKAGIDVDKLLDISCATPPPN